jgi:RNA polymerase sigma factor (sigma-70 family)
MANRSDLKANVLAKGRDQNRTVLETIYRRYREAVRRYVARHFGMGPPDPEDVVQAAFEKFSQMEAPGDIDNPYTFLVRCSRNYVVDQRRRLAVRESYAANVTLIETEADDLDAERVLASRQRWEKVARAITTLDARRREMLLMNRLDGLSFAEIARQNGCSPSLVRQMVVDALVICRNAIEQEDVA